MAFYIKQGDAYSVPISCRLNGDELDIDAVENAEICVGNLRKTYPGEIEYDSESGYFMFPVKQEETLGMEPYGTAEVDVRVKFVGGSVIGSRLMKYIPVYDAVSEEVI